MARPSIKLVDKSGWHLAYESELVSVLYGTAVFQDDYFMVMNHTTGKTKYFYGELAHQDAKRFAADIDFGAWGF